MKDFPECATGSARRYERLLRASDRRLYAVVADHWLLRELERVEASRCLRFGNRAAKRGGDVSRAVQVPEAREDNDPPPRLVEPRHCRSSVCDIRPRIPAHRPAVWLFVS